MNRHAHLALAAALLAVVGAAPARAQDEPPPRAQVRTGDLNLRGAQGRATLSARVRNAANAVCDQGGGVKDLATQTEEARCRRDAMRSGEAQAATQAARQEAASRAERETAARRAVARHDAARRRHRHARHATVHRKVSPPH